RRSDFADPHTALPPFPTRRSSDLASETTATRSPRGIGCSAKAIARSKSSSIEFARRTPVWENTASAARSEPPREPVWDTAARLRSEEHTSELQSRVELVCRLLLEK